MIGQQVFCGSAIIIEVFGQAVAQLKEGVTKTVFLGVSPYRFLTVTNLFIKTLRATIGKGSGYLCISDHGQNCRKDFCYTLRAEMNGADTVNSHLRQQWFCFRTLMYSSTCSHVQNEIILRGRID